MNQIIIVACLVWAMLTTTSYADCPSGYTCYYFAATGNDSTGAGTQLRPWASVAKAMTKTNLTVSVPTAVLFNQGDTWTSQQYDINGAIGTAANPIVIGTYGTGAPPIFDEANTQNFCFDAHAMVAQYITLGDGVGFECKHAKYGGVNFYTNTETSSTPSFPGITIENMYVHNTGNGCSTTNGPCQGDDTIGCTGSACVYEFDNQIAFQNESACNNTSSGCAGDSVHMINNIVRWVGGHNCTEIHGDYGQAIEANNTVGPGCGHEVLDVKQSGWSTATAPDSRTALIHDNVVDVGVSLGLGQAGQAAVILLGSYDPNTSVAFYNNKLYDAGIGVEVCANNQLQNNGSVGLACALGPNCNTHAYIYNNTLYLQGVSPNAILGPWCFSGSTTLNGAITNSQTTLIVASGTGFVPAGGFGAPFVVTIGAEQILVGGASSATSWNTLTRGYNGTTAASHADNSAVSGGAYGTGVIDVRNNIFDGSKFNYSTLGQPSTLLFEDYNDCGGVQGGPGGGTCSGAHDLTNVDPQYDLANLNPPDNAVPPTFRINNPALVGQGQRGLISCQSSC